MKFRWAKALTGGVDGYLDNIYADNLVDGDPTIVAVAGTGIYFYIYDDDSAEAESSPDVIAPDNASSGVAYTGDGRHILVADVSLTADIATNTSAIATNVSGIATNVTNIAANTSRFTEFVCVDNAIVCHDNEPVYME